MKRGKNKKTRGKKHKAVEKKPVAKNGQMQPCPKCRYKMRHLHGGKCPMCLDCSNCSEKLHSCKCCEGE